jgi:hypothetical protein
VSESPPRQSLWSNVARGLLDAHVLLSVTATLGA